MKRNSSSMSERRMGWIRLGNDVPKIYGDVRESKNNRCYASSHRHSGVCEVGMLRSVIETSREILIGANSLHKLEASDVTSSLNKSMMADKEVGVAHSSVDDSVMEFGAKEPYLVDVNREEGPALAVLARRRKCDG